MALRREETLTLGSGWAVRRDWPDGAHEFIRFSVTPLDLVRWIGRDRRAWRRSPIYPSGWVVVAISGHDFDLHRRRTLCRAPDCPDEEIPTERASSADSSGVEGGGTSR